MARRFWPASTRSAPTSTPARASAARTGRGCPPGWATRPYASTGSPSEGQGSRNVSAEDLLPLLDRIVAQAGTDEGVEAFGLDETETVVKAHNGALESLSSARRRGIGIRVVTDQRVGYCYTVDLDERKLAAALSEARENATVGTPDVGNVLAEPVEAPP